MEDGGVCGFGGSLGIEEVMRLQRWNSGNMDAQKNCVAFLLVRFLLSSIQIFLVLEPVCWQS